MFLFHDPAPPEIYTPSLHDALPIFTLDADDTQPPEIIPGMASMIADGYDVVIASRYQPGSRALGDRKSTRLNSSHRCISYAVFCLKKKKTKTIQTPIKQRQQTTANR